MKQLLICTLILFASCVYSQSHGYTNFESGTLEDWTNSDGSTTNLTIESPGFGGSYHLKKVCDGTNTVLGEMAITNSSNFGDNYMNGGAVMISFWVKNENTFDLHLRLGFTDIDGTEIVTTTPIIVPPMTGEWQEVDFEIGPILFTLISGPNSIEDLLFETHDLKLIHNQNVSFDGAYENGTFEIDEVGTLYLGVDDFTKESVIVYPVPVKERVHIKTNTITIKGVEMYDLFGKKQKINTTDLESINVTHLAAGVYFLKITGEKGTIVKKIIKN